LKQPVKAEGGMACTGVGLEAVPCASVANKRVETGERKRETFGFLGWGERKW